METKPEIYSYFDGNSVELKINTNLRTTDGKIVTVNLYENGLMQAIRKHDYMMELMLLVRVELHHAITRKSVRNQLDESFLNRINLILNTKERNYIRDMVLDDDGINDMHFANIIKPDVRDVLHILEQNLIDCVGACDREFEDEMSTATIYKNCGIIIEFVQKMSDDMPF